MTQNPFNQEENIDLWLEKDAGFQKVKKDTFLKYAQKYGLNPNIIMSLKELYLKIVNFITKNVIAATVLLTLVVAGASVTAAQILLPRYKPSALLQEWFEKKIETPVPAEQKSNPFSINTQSQKDPSQLLVADENNNVFVNHTCGVIVKYPKKFANSITKATIFLDGNPQYPEYPPYDDLSDNISIYTISKDNSYGGSAVAMRCSTDKPKSDPFEVRVSKEKLQEVTGWFLTAADIDEVILLENENIPFAYNYSFKYRDLYYSGSFIEKAAGTKEQRKMDYLGGLYSTQVQIQFKDQVPNPPQIPAQSPQQTPTPTAEVFNNNSKSVPSNVKSDPDFPVLLNISNFKEEYLDKDFFTYKNSCIPIFSSEILYTPKSEDGLNQGFLAVDSSSLIDNNLILEYQNQSNTTAEVLNNEKVATEFSNFLNSKQSKSEKQSMLLNQIFQDCDFNRFYTPVSGYDLKLNNTNARAFITFSEYFGQYRVVTYTKKGKYLMAMSTYFSRPNYKTDYTGDPFNFTKEDIVSATEAAFKLLKTFELKWKNFLYLL